MIEDSSLDPADRRHSPSRPSSDDKQSARLLYLCVALVMLSIAAAFAWTQWIGTPLSPSQLRAQLHGLAACERAKLDGYSRDGWLLNRDLIYRVKRDCIWAAEEGKRDRLQQAQRDAFKGAE